MINAVLVFNNAGQPRLTKFYTQLETSVQQRLISEIFTLVANRPNSACNFLPCVVSLSLHLGCRLIHFLSHTLLTSYILTSCTPHLIHSPNTLT